MAKNTKIHYRKPRFCVWITVRLVLSPATRGDGPLAAGCPRSYVNLQALRDPAPRILDSVGISRKLRIKSYVILQAWRDPMPRFSDSVVKSKNHSFKSYVNLHAIRDPMLHLPERGGGSENGPRLSLGNGAIFAPKVTCFTVYLLAGSHRSRAAAPDLYESSIVLADPGCPGRDPKVHGKTRHFCHFVPCILDSVANSGGKLPNGARGHTKSQPGS